MREEQGEGLWEHREFMPMAWQSLVTHRLLMRALSQGSRASTIDVPQRFGAKWHLPLQDSIAAFCINDGGFTSC